MSEAMIISNEFLEVTVSPQGAELKSIHSKTINRELLWQGDPEVWSGQAPVLFPLIGRLKDKKYVAYGKEYSIDLHGFARTSSFKVAAKSDTQVIFELSDSEETRKIYPFSFLFSVSYKLQGNKIIKAHTVENKSDKTMFFELGGHEAYSLELFEGDKMTDYELRFEGEKALQTYTVDENTMLNKNTAEIEVLDGVLSLSPEVFKNDALILENLKQRKAELWHKKEGRIVSLKCDEFPYLGIWTKYIPENGRYICLEPWSSLPDGNFLDYALENKRGIISLPKGQSEKLTYTIEF